jgi:hypothetical protein
LADSDVITHGRFEVITKCRAVAPPRLRFNIPKEKMTMTNSTRSNTFGGNGGSSFDDSHDIDAWGPVRQIVVRHGSEVDSIGVFWANGNFLNHGGTGGSETVINLDPDELISRVDGRSGDRLDQITFRSNKRVYGPFGGSGGAPFTVDFGGKALHYLFGRSGSEVDQVGFGFGNQPAALPTTIVRSGAHGGTGGNPFDDLSAAGNLLGKITAITVRHGSVVDDIAASYDGQPGSNAHGGNGGNQDTFSLGPDEWVTQIRGRSGSLLDQVQFFLNSGRVSPVYGGNGGNPFTENRANSVVKSFFGRSGSQVDQLGFYFEDAKPLSIDITSMNFSLAQLNVAAMPPEVAMTVLLKNSTSGSQQVGQTEAIAVTDTSTTSVTETNQANVSFTVKTDFLVTGSSVTVGYTHGQTTMTGSTNAVAKTYTVNFQATVPANSTIQGNCIVRQSTYDVPWTATAEVTYQDRPQPTIMTLHGTLTGVATTAVEAEYDPAKAM